MQPEPGATDNSPYHVSIEPKRQLRSQPCLACDNTSRWPPYNLVYDRGGRPD